jgi:hypothetical protein
MNLPLQLCDRLRAAAAAAITIAVALAAADVTAAGATRCSMAFRPDSIVCGDVQIPRSGVDRVTFDHLQHRDGDGIDASLTDTSWPLGLAPGSYLFVSWHDESGPRNFTVTVSSGEHERLISEVRAQGYNFIDAVTTREELRRRIVHAKDHVRKYLDKPFRAGSSFIGAGTYEFTLLENPDGLDMLCIEDQAMIARRRWWLIPAHILPTDDKFSQGVIVYEDASASELRMSEIRFPLKKALPID